MGWLHYLPSLHFGRRDQFIAVTLVVGAWSITLGLGWCRRAKPNAKAAAHG